MAQNILINGVTYSDVPQVEIPKTNNGGTAVFYDTAAATADAGDILSGKTAFCASGSVNGSMTDNGTVTGTISTKAGTYTIPAGKHSGSGTVAIDSTEQGKIISDNIKATVTILGVTGKSSVVDTADADATAAQILSGKYAYVNGSKIQGSMTAATVSQDSTTKVLSIA